MAGRRLRLLRRRETGYGLRMSRATANLLLLTTAAIWGSAFVAQSLAMRVLDPLWYTGLRFLLAAAALAPFAWRERRAATASGRLPPIALAIVCVLMCGASVLQQEAMRTTSATNAGFLTSLYVLFTPIAARALDGERARGVVWAGAGLGIAGSWLLAGGLDGFAIGDVYIVITAVVWAVLIVLIGRIVRNGGGPVGLAFAQSLFTGAACTVLAGALVPVSAAAVEAAFWPILYGGLLSGGLAYTLQAVAQRHAGPSDAAIVFAAEAPFAALAGALVLDERITARGAAGCLLIFAAIVLVSAWPRRATPAAGA